MKSFDELNDDNFLEFAAKYYNNPQCTSEEEFYDDLNRFKYLKRLMKRYFDKGDLQERLILNHIIILYNVFGIPAANRMMFFKFEPHCWPLIKTFLIFLHYLKPNEYNDIPLDDRVIEVLRNL